MADWAELLSLCQHNVSEGFLCGLGQVQFPHTAAKTGGILRVTHCCESCVSDSHVQVPQQCSGAALG